MKRSPSGKDSSYGGLIIGDGSPPEKKPSSWIVFQVWLHPDCKSLGEAINNPKLRRSTSFSKEVDADRYLKQCLARKERDFTYWKKAVV